MYHYLPEKALCFCLLSGLLFRGGQIRLSRLLRPLSAEDELWEITGLKAAERTSDFSVEV